MSQSSERFRVGDLVTCYRRGRWWSAEFYSAGKQQRESLKTKSKKEARSRAIQLEARLATGDYRPRPQRTTIAALVESHLRQLETEDRAPTTLKRYRPELERWSRFFEEHGARYIDDITLSLVEQYRSRRKPQVAPATLYHETTLIRQLVNFAIKRDLLRRDPLKDLSVARPRPTPQPCFTLEQVNAILAESGRYADLFMLLAFTGLRIGESRWLTWADVELNADHAGGFLHVRAKPDWQPKDRDDRRVPLHRRVARMLAGRPRDAGFVYTAGPSPRYPNGGRQISDRHALQKLKSVLRRLGIPAGSLHSFRHFFISFCANNGIEPFKVMQWVGHSDLQIILRYYNLNDDESARSIVRVPFDAASNEAGPVREQAQNKHNRGARRAG